MEDPRRTRCYAGGKLAVNLTLLKPLGINFITIRTGNGIEVKLLDDSMCLVRKTSKFVGFYDPLILAIFVKLYIEITYRISD